MNVMKPRLSIVLLIAGLSAWLASGVYVVRSNEVAVVRVFGRAQRTETGEVRVAPNGLYWHLPWPLASVDLVNLNETRTLTIGGLEALPDNAAAFLQVADPAVRTQFVSGDKNILHVTFNVHYRVSPTHVGQWLYGAASSEGWLLKLSESALADVVMRCGVDFLHTLGHGDVRATVLAALRREVARTAIGVEIDDVTLVGIAPPIRVKADFVDVMNARAERETQINLARAYAEQREADSQASRQTALDGAQQFQRRIIDRGTADAEVVQAIEKGIVESNVDAATAKQLYLSRLHLAVREDLVRNSKRLVVVPPSKDGGVTINGGLNELPPSDIPTTVIDPSFGTSIRSR